MPPPHFCLKVVHKIGACFWELTVHSVCRQLHYRFHNTKQAVCTKIVVPLTSVVLFISEVSNTTFFYYLSGSTAMKYSIETHQVRL